VEDVSTIHLSNSATASKQREEQAHSSSSDGDIPAKERSRFLVDDPAWVEIPNKRVCLGLGDPQRVKSTDGWRHGVPNDMGMGSPHTNQSQTWHLRAEWAARSQFYGLPLQVHSDQEGACTIAAPDLTLPAHATFQNNIPIPIVKRLRRKKPQRGNSRDCFAFIVKLDGPNITSVLYRKKATIKSFLERHIRNSRRSGCFFDQNLRIVELDPSKHGATDMDRFFQAEDVLVYQETDHDDINPRTLMKKITCAVQKKKKEAVASSTSRKHEYRLRARPGL
jgi:hypothetical protein